MVDVVAHRGDSWGAIENTIPAFRSAMDLGVDVIELDARVTADGVPVVLHDATLSRIWGLPERVDVLTADRVTSLRRAGVGIPTLAEALDSFTDGSVRVMVDLPSGQNIDRIIQVVTASRAEADGRVIWSGERSALAAVRDALPTAVIYTHRPDPELTPTMINMDGSDLTAEDIAAAHDRGQGMSVWTVDDPAAMRGLIAAGVDSITTNRPDLLLRVRDDLGDGPDLLADLDADIARYREVALALAAEAIRMQRSAGDLTVETKLHAADLVTEVDRGIERLVREVLAAEFEGHAVVGEEYGGEPGAGPTWYCDPVDGTTNFANHLPWSSFSLCLVCDGRPVVGVVADPWRHETYDAVAGAGARLNGVPVTRPRPSALTGGVVGTEWASYRPWPGMHALLQSLADRHCTTRVMGSSTLTLAQVAVGRTVGAVIGEFHPEDHLAAALLCQEAGMVVRDQSGNPDPFPRRGGIMAARPEVADELFALWQAAIADEA